MHTALGQLEHRPWPIPAARWTWRQTWRDLLFAHWQVPAAQLRPLLLPPLELDEFDGRAWVSLVPFRMTGVMRRPWPNLPWVSAFPELNVRTYVTCAGKPGVWFLSLDATNPLAVWGARRYFYLPYFRARISCREAHGAVHYVSHRLGAAFAATYRPLGEPYCAAAGTLDHWLTERYCLYARAPDGGLWRNEVHHAPWPLQPGAAEIRENTLFEYHGLAAGGPPALLQFARRLDVVVWRGERVA